MTDLLLYAILVLPGTSTAMQFVMILGLNYALKEIREAIRQHK